MKMFVTKMIWFLDPAVFHYEIVPLIHCEGILDLCKKCKVILCNIRQLCKPLDSVLSKFNLLVHLGESGHLIKHD